MFTLLLGLILISPDDTLYIAIDDRPETHFITDWLDKPMSAVNPKDLSWEQRDRLRQLDELRSKILPKLVLIRWDDLEARKKYGFAPFPTYPYYRMGRYGVWKEFDKRAFESHSITLRYIGRIFHEQTIEQEQVKWEEDYYEAKCYIYYHHINLVDVTEALQEGNVMYLCDYDLLFAATQETRKRHPELVILPVVAQKPYPKLDDPLATEPSQ